MLASHADLPEEIAALVTERSTRRCGACCRNSRAALAENLPLDRRDGGFIADGFDAALDETRALRDESRRVIAELAGDAIAISPARDSLRIKHNNMLGFFIETTQAQGERLRQPPLDATFLHRQTMVGAMRFSTRELAELEAKIASAADRALAIEQGHFDRLVDAHRGPARSASSRRPTRWRCSMSLRRSRELARAATLDAAVVDDSLAFVDRRWPASGRRGGGARAGRRLHRQ